MDKETLLKEVNKIEGVQGSMIVSKDGLVQSNSMDGSVDANLTGAVLSSVFGNIDAQSKRMQRGRVKRFIIETESDTLSVSEFNIQGESLLVFTQGGKELDLDKITSALNALNA